MDAPDLRVSDRERDAAVERLRTAASEGRLTSEELEERTGQALAARTQAELAGVTRDLPVPRPQAAPVEQGDRSLLLRSRLAGFLIPNFICILIWAATGAGSFWPIWVLLGTGIGFGVFLIRFLLGVEEEERRAQERRRRHERRREERRR